MIGHLVEQVLFSESFSHKLEALRALAHQSKDVLQEIANEADSHISEIIRRRNRRYWMPGELTVVGRTESHSILGARYLRMLHNLPSEKVELVLDLFGGFSELIPDNTRSHHISSKNANEICRLVHQAIGISHFNRPYIVCILPYQYPEINSQYDNNSATILCTRVNPSDCSPNYVLFHEIGHLIHYGVLGSLEPPSSFLPFILKHSIVNTSKIPDDDLREIFADLFAVAMMLHTRFESEHPTLEVLTANQRIEIRDYFKDLFQQNRHKFTPSFFGLFSPKA
ncbi:MAG: hypothetical protein IM631_12490 [Cytophagales bacterium]|nr:hypothetical protein [Cytophagales bacterium]MCA6382333.1 hypothetical protein [Cytophagales bacterium]